MWEMSGSLPQRAAQRTRPTLNLTRVHIHYVLNVPSSPTHPPAACPETDANLKAELILSDLMTDALLRTPTVKPLCSGHDAGLLFENAATTQPPHLVGGSHATCFGRPLWLSLLFWLVQITASLLSLGCMRQFHWSPTSSEGRGGSIAENFRHSCF